MKKSKKSFMFELMGLFFAVMLWCFPMEVSAEGEYKLPFHTTYDIAEGKFTVHLTLETEEDVYLAYYAENVSLGSVDRDTAFESATFVESKTLDMTLIDKHVTLFWVVDKDHNVLANVYPQFGEEVFEEENALFQLYLYQNARYYQDKDFSDAVEFVNGDDLSEHVFEAKMENGRLTVNMPNMDGSGNINISRFLKGAQEVKNYNRQVSFDGGQVTKNISELITGTGEYTLVYWLSSDGVRSKNQYITYTYEEPEQKVGAPVDLKWDAETPGRFTFAASEPRIDIECFEVLLQIVIGQSHIAGVEAYQYTGEYEGKFSANYDWYLEWNKNNNYAYRVGVRIISSDIDNYAHSDWVFSDVYDPNAEEKEKQVRAFVERMYTVALGRESDPSGIDYWANQLLTYQANGASLSEGFILSDEFAEKNYSNAEYLEVLYKTFFNREADEGGIAHWMSQMESGKSRRSVLAGFVNSNEFGNLCISYGIERGVMSEDEPGGEVPAEGGVEQFVERLYTVCLERASEPAGLADWTRRINAGESTPEEVAKFFFMSEEYVKKNTSDEKYIETLYLTFMDRTADAGGKAYWVELLTNGVSRETALSGFAQSPEFQEIMDRYGL